MKQTKTLERRLDMHPYLQLQNKDNRRCKWMDISSLFKVENENKSNKQSYKQKGKPVV